jgi:hypothetical protein
LDKNEFTATLGTTIRLRAKFYDWVENGIDGQNLRPELVKFKVMNAHYTEILVDAHVSPSLDTKTGETYFEYFYTTDTLGTLNYEWYGEAQGLPTVERGLLNVYR